MRSTPLAMFLPDHVTRAHGILNVHSSESVVVKLERGDARPPRDCGWQGATEAVDACFAPQEFNHAFPIATSALRRG